MADALINDLLKLGVQPGGVLLVHSSLRSLGPRTERITPERVITALLETLGPQGTLLMPALSYASVRSDHPVFDARTTPSCVGALTEYFRTRPGTLRSIHPTHSVCGVGQRAEELLANHERDLTPCGANSPFSKLPKVGGQVLFIGCGLRPNTSMHGVEEHIVPAYLFASPLDYQIIRADGSQLMMTVRRHNFVGWHQRYDRLEGLMTHGLRRGPVLRAGCFLLDAAEMWVTALAQMRRDPLYFVDQHNE